MARVFLSYAREDLKRARSVGAALEKAGHSVWWDRQLVGGSEYSTAIDAALAEADAVVVLWSKTSVASPWVRDEAAKGRDTGRLVPATIDGTGPPLGFGQFHTIDLSRPSGRTELVSAVASRSAATAPAAASGNPLGRPTRRSQWAAAVGLIIALAAGLLWFALPRGGSADEPTVAVLPFRDMSADRSQAPLGEGVAEEVMSLLSGDANLAVIGRSSAWQFAGRPAELARLGVTHVLEGSVRSSPSDLVVTARLIDLSSGEQVWTEQFERRPEQIFEVQEQIGQAVAKQLSGIFEAQRQVQQSAAKRTSPRAYHLYLAARAANRERSFENARKAEGLLEQALAVDPNYAPAHAEMAIVQALIGQSRPSGAPGFDAEKAVRHARRAVELAPDFPDAHVALAFAARDPQERLRAIRTAAQLDPGSDRAWNALGLIQRRGCELRNAVESFRRASAIDPLGIAVHQNLAGTLFDIGQRAEADEAVSRFLSVSRSQADKARLLTEHRFRSGDIAEAVRQARVGLELQPGDPQFAHYLARGSHLLGLEQEAAEALPGAFRPILPAYWSGDYAQAAKAAASVPREELVPGSSFLKRAAAKALLWANQPGAAAKLLLGDRSLAEFENHRNCFEYDSAVLAQALLGFGHEAGARQVLSRGERNLKKALANGYAQPDRYVYAATIAAARRQDDRALQLLESAIAGGWVNQWEPISPGLNDPVFRNLRNHPRFRAIEGRIAQRLTAEAADLKRTS